LPPQLNLVDVVVQALFIAALMVGTARLAWLVSDLSHCSLDLRGFLGEP